MARNRIIYQNEGLFVGPEEGNIAGNFEYVQSISYDFNVPKQPANVLGKSSSIDRTVAGIPDATLTINYMPNSFDNEELVNLNVSKNSTHVSVTADISSETDRYKDKTNIYLATAKEGSDLKGAHINDVSGVLAFGTCTLTSYSFSAGVGSFPEASMSFVAEDASYFVSGKDLDVPILNRRTREATGWLDITLPKSATDKVIMSSEEDITVPGNVSVKITDSKAGVDTEFENISNDNVQNFSFDFSLNRSPVNFIGHKMNIDRLISYPAEVTASMELIASESQVSGFNDFIKKDPRYEIEVDVLNGNGAKKMKYTLKNASIEEISYTESTEDSKKTVNLQLFTELDPLDQSQGLFLSGTF